VAPEPRSISWGEGTVVVLAGGASRRMGGKHKPELELASVSLLDRALAGWPRDVDIVVVGPEMPTSRTVRWCREDPVGGGPTAAVAAAMAFVQSSWVALMAADTPFIAPGVEPLVRGAVSSIRSGGDGAWLVGASGHPQPLASCVDCAALVSALPKDPSGAPLRRVLHSLSLRPVPARDEWLMDADTPEDLLLAERTLRGMAPDDPKEKL